MAREMGSRLDIVVIRLDPWHRCVLIGMGVEEVQGEQVYSRPAEGVSFHASAVVTE